jgi:hypothetical protein
MMTRIRVGGTRNLDGRRIRRHALFHLVIHPRCPPPIHPSHMSPCPSRPFVSLNISRPRIPILLSPTTGFTATSPLQEMRFHCNPVRSRVLHVCIRPRRRSDRQSSLQVFLLVSVRTYKDSISRRCSGERNRVTIDTDHAEKMMTDAGFCGSTCFEPGVARHRDGATFVALFLSLSKTCVKGKALTRQPLFNVQPLAPAPPHPFPRGMVIAPSPVSRSLHSSGSLLAPLSAASSPSLVQR